MGASLALRAAGAVAEVCSDTFGKELVPLCAPELFPPWDLPSGCSSVPGCCYCPGTPGKGARAQPMVLGNDAPVSSAGFGFGGYFYSEEDF